MSKLLLFLHLHLRLCHRLRLCFTAFISQIRLHLLKMKRSSSNKELLFLFNSDFSDAEAAQGALEITSIRGDVGGFFDYSNSNGGGSWKRCFQLSWSWCTALLYYLLNRKINKMLRMQTRNVLTTTIKKQKHQSMEMKWYNSPLAVHEMIKIALAMSLSHLSTHFIKKQNFMNPLKGFIFLFWLGRK